MFSSQVPHQQKNVDLPIVTATLQNAFANNVHHVHQESFPLVEQIANVTNVPLDNTQIKQDKVNANHVKLVR